MGWLSDFYKRKKNPWLGFILVLLFGPFGFLYHSWKTALAILLVVGPLWIAFLRHTRFDLIAVPWAHYSALVFLAGFAVLQIKANQQEEARIDSALTVLSANKRGPFLNFLKENPELHSRVKAMLMPVAQPDGQIARSELALLVANYGLCQLENGNFSGAASSYLYSMQIFPENPMAWAGMAETYAAWEDRIADRWARKVLSFRTSKGGSEVLDRVFADAAVNGTLDEMKARMRAIIELCSQHPEWRDSYPLKRMLHPDL